MAVALDTSYHVGNAPISLTIVIGDAQLGDSIVSLNRKVVGQGDIGDLVIGDGADLRGQTLSIKSVVTDVNDKTNNTSIRYLLKGGLGNGTFDLSAAVPEEGDSLIYRAQVHFE